MRHSSRTAALTLTELMVVVVLIAVIAALTLPMIGVFRREGLRVKCVSTLRQYGTALFAYLADHQHRFPEEGLNFDALLVPRYLKETLRCPLYQRPGERGLYYTGNAGLSTYFRNPMTIDAPHSRVVFASELYFNVSGFWSPTQFNMTVWGVNEAMSHDPVQRETRSGSARRPQHHGTSRVRKLNLFFLDGHIESLAPKGNNWWLPVSQGGLYHQSPGEGIFYETNQFRLIKLRRMKYE